MWKESIIILKLIAFYCVAAAQYKKYNFQQPKMGSPFNIVIYSTDSVAAEKAALQAFRMIDTLNEVYSDYLPFSELNRLCKTSGSGRWVVLSDALFSILQKSYAAARISSGSFDVTMSPVIRLWRTARKEKRLPDKDRVLNFERQGISGSIFR